MMALRILCAVALLLLSVVPRNVAEARMVPAAEVASLVLPDGSLPTLCQPSLDEIAKTKMPSSHGATPCDLCLLGASLALLNVPEATHPGVVLSDAACLLISGLLDRSPDRWVLICAEI